MRGALREWLEVVMRRLLALLARLYGQHESVERLVAASQGGSSFVTYHCRPKASLRVGTKGGTGQSSRRLAVVIQGPIIDEDAFTLETARIYRRHFAESHIILSTWEDEDPSVVRCFEALGITVIRNVKPDYAGIGNVNLQIASSRSGMRCAKESGAEYALKTRTDQRMYAPNIAAFLYDVTEAFPVHGDWVRQNKRIVGCSLNTFKHRMYGLSDMWMYGQMDDMLQYWDTELDSRAFDVERMHRETKSLRSWARWRVCEVYLATEFLGKVGRELEWTLHDSWSAFADHFCVIDRESLDLFWRKYGHRENRWLTYEGDMRMQELNFREWLVLHAGVEAGEIPEELMDVPFV